MQDESEVLIEMEEKYPKMMNEFEDITHDMVELFSRKQADYGPKNIGMGEIVVDTDDKVKRSLLALSVRINDKVQRLLNLTMNNREPNNESLEDTFIDMANYSIISLLVKRMKWK